ncbi:MAG TPA: glycosyltransferase family 39 protein [Candidatus Binataceae bacterium]|nr:glycosyltransferase family 39 protein [Candidatus Binataceae bacterium]
MTALRTPRFDSTVIVILCAAFAIGGWLRFEHLDRLDMNGGEAVSWVAAAQPTVYEVIAHALPLNPGKLGAHDVALHLWMRVFGDRLTSIRALSAFCGLLSIVFIFLLVRELFASLDNGRIPTASRDWIAAITALLAALSPTLIHHSQEARMYALLVAAIVAQVWFFIRAVRIGGWLNYVALTAASLLAIAAHFTAGSVMIAEALWLAPDLVSNLRHGENPARIRTSLKVIGALVCAGLILLPILYVPIRFAAGFVSANGFRWVRPPVLLAPLEFFVLGAAGGANGPLSSYHPMSAAFIVMASLAVWGAIRGLRSAGGAVTFALLWMFVPTILPQILSYLVTPFFLFEYALPSYIPFLMLVALGIRELGAWRSYVALALVLAFAVAPIQLHRARTVHEQWQAASEFTAANLRPDQFAMVVPGWTADVMHYYLRNRPDVRVEGAPNHAAQIAPPFPNLLIVTSAVAVKDPIRIRLLAADPHLLRKYIGLSVYGPPP